MSNYERLCKYLGIEPEYGYTIYNKEVYIKNCNKAGVIALFSKKTDLKVVEVNKEMNFTAEKQIKLIDLIVKRKKYYQEQEFKIKFIKEDNKFYIGCSDFVSANNDFAEALADLVLQLIRECRIQKEKAKEVLEQ